MTDLIEDLQIHLENPSNSEDDCDPSDLEDDVETTVLPSYSDEDNSDASISPSSSPKVSNKSSKKLITELIRKGVFNSDEGNPQKSLTGMISVLVQISLKHFLLMISSCSSY